MKLLNSKFNIDEVLRINPKAEEWYKQAFPQNTFMFKSIRSMCQERFVVYDVARFLRSGGIHLYVQKVSELSTNPSAEYIIFVLNKSGCCADPNLCWVGFNEPLFIKDK